MHDDLYYVLNRGLPSAVVVAVEAPMDVAWGALSPLERKRRSFPLPSPYFLPFCFPYFFVITRVINSKEGLSYGAKKKNIAKKTENLS